MPSELGYDALLVLWRVVINIFFREIRPRGAYNIPRDGPVIFVAAPHSNQFLDPLLLMSVVYREVGRRVAFLIAAKSMKRAAVGFFAGMMSSIPVSRAADDAKSGSGTITISSEDPCLIRGTNTHFTAQCKPQMQIQLPHYANSAASEIVEVISDTELRIKKEFGQKILDKLAESDENGTKYKLLPHVDQKAMYENVYRRLQEGRCIGIFPEGGSHDRTDLLPLKAGVAIMALGAMAANPNLKVKIIPVGLSYFHPDRFRSRAVVEFGSAMDIPPELVELFKEGGLSKRSASGKLLDLIYDGLKTVTLRAPDYETLMVIQAGRRLYKTPGQHLSLGQVVELNKRFIDGYMHFKDEPRIQQLRANVLKYNRLVRDLGLRDHQVPRAQRASWRTFGLLTYRIGLLVVWSVLALPGLVLNGPIFLLASIISKKKAKEALAASTVKIAGRDVLASWKVLISLGVTPFLYGLYAFLATVIAIKAGAPIKWRIWTPFLVIMALPVIGYCALKFGEAGIDVLKSLRPLVISLFPGQQKLLEQLKEQRKSLSNEVADVINEFGPALYEDFDEWRILVPSASVPPSSSGRPGLFRTRSATGGLDAQGNLLVHPMKWLDERLFGWSRSPRRGTSVWGGTSSVNTSRHVSPEASDDEDHGDYDNVIGYLPHIEGRAGPSSLGRERSSKSLRSSYADLHQGRRLTLNTGESSAVATGANVHLAPIYHQKRTVNRSPEGVRYDTPPSPTSDGPHLRSGPRERRQSLSGSVGVERIGDVSPVETFKEATEDLNREIRHDD